MSLRLPKLRLPAPAKTSPIVPSADPSQSVGYGHPPLKSRFKSGQSGNPRGRPKGARNKMPELNEERLKIIIMAEAYRTIKINDGSRQVNVPMVQAVVRSLAVNAVKGQHRSQRLFSELLSATESSYKSLHDEWLEKALDYKKSWEDEIAYCRDRGLPPPDPVPHPDHIDLDMRTGQIVVDGPMTRKQRDSGRNLVVRLLDSHKELAWLTKERAKTRNVRMQAIYDTDIGHEKRFQTMMMDCIRKTPWMNREWRDALKAPTTKSKL